MLYLRIFGNNVEHRFGHALFLLFFLFSGLGGSLAQIAVDPNGVIPNLVASGAIAGVMEAWPSPRDWISQGLRNVFFLATVV